MLETNEVLKNKPFTFNDNSAAGFLLSELVNGDTLICGGVLHLGIEHL